MAKTTKYYIKKPDKHRNTFAIYKHVSSPDSIKNITIENSDVDAINKQLLSRQISYEDACKQVVAIRNRIAAIPPTVFNADNERILASMLKSYFLEKPFIVDKVSATHKYKRAVLALGKLPLMGVTRDEALACIMALPNNGKQREAAHKLNSIFKRLGRELVIPVPPKDHEEVAFISEEELDKIVTGLQGEAKTILAAAIKLSFYTGLRVGELRGLTTAARLPDGNTLSITTQLDVREKKRAPKHRKKRKAFMHDKAKDAFVIWTTKTVGLNHKQLNTQFQKACVKYIGRSSLTWHDLRHSYAIYLLSAGVPIQLVAQSLGNSVRVCEECYAGHIFSDQGLETIKRVLSS